jgi:hypothetical protein
MSYVHIERVCVRRERIEATVRVADASALRTSDHPGSADRAIALLPGLSRHSCRNRSGRRFVDELSDTEIAHLFEHIAVELMALSGSPRTLNAETTWDFSTDGRGVFRISIEYDVDLVGLAALKEGASVTQWVLGERGERPDVDALVARLKALRD